MEKKRRRNRRKEKGEEQKGEEKMTGEREIYILSSGKKTCL